MRFRRSHQRLEPLSLVQLAPYLNVFLLLVVFGLLASTFLVPSAMEVRLPKALTSDVAEATNIAIIISSENIIYFNQQIVSMGELRKRLMGRENTSHSVLIKVDRRASVGRLIEIWDLCRSMGIAQIAIAANTK